jgi:hypothetical protein
MPWIATTAFHSRSLTIYRRQTFDLVYLRAYISLITPEILPGSQHSFLPLYRIQLDFLCERVCFLKAAQIFFFSEKILRKRKVKYVYRVSFFRAVMANYSCNISSKWVPLFGEIELRKSSIHSSRRRNFMYVCTCDMYVCTCTYDTRTRVRYVRPT